ncbi:MAG: hypothetical protein HOC71_07515 [Candidatus Latescibacteria bacterium]|jgi:hypothetical protein|nr:hypothetical protein [Candidatus Latescibacterota bacterium]
MKTGKTVKKIILSAFVFCIALAAFSTLVHAQYELYGRRSLWRQDFVSREYRPRWEDRYENFGSYDIRKYPRDYQNLTRRLDIGSNNDKLPTRRGPVSPVTFDQFGNFLLPGGEIFSMRFDQSRLGAMQSPPDNLNTSANQNYRWVNNVFNNLMVVSDEFSNWQTRFMMARGAGNGTGIRTYFTPSTLKQTNFSGFRWDASTRKNNISIVATTDEYDPLAYSQNKKRVSYPLYGVHWESQLGDIMKLGATFVSKQRGTLADSHQDIDWKIQGEPRYVYVVITDDSPEDTGAGAKVYDIKAVVNGKKEPIAFKGEDYNLKGRVFKIPDLFERKRYYSGKPEPQKEYVVDQDAGEHLRMDTSELRNRRESWFLELMDQRILEDLLSKRKTGENGYLSIFDPDEMWDPDDPNDRKRLFKADMIDSDGVFAGHNEAKGSDVIIYEFLVPQGTRKLAFNILVANDYCIDMVTPFYSWRQEGEAGWYDEPLSDKYKDQWSIIEYDMKHCVRAPGNIKDTSNMKWVSVSYNRMTGMNVYGMNMEMNWRGLYVRAEYNEYNTYWSYPLAEKMSGASKEIRSARAWFVNASKDFGKWSVGTEIFNYPNEYMQYWAPIDDNDDDDRYVGGNEYPGRDADFDRGVDTTWSGSPYLNYFYDSITVGDDFNHNGSIDSRENDNQIDLPYDRDSKGQHYFLKIRPREATILTLGHYDIRQEYFDGRNFTRYLKFEHHQRIGNMGEFLFYSRTERRKDNYKLDENHHKYYNDWNFSNILATRLSFIPNMNFINNFRFSTSYNVGDMRRLDGTQDENNMNLLQIYNGDKSVKRYGAYSLGLEHKADYQYRIADARLIPEITIGGYRLLKEKRIKELQIMPMIKLVHTYGYNHPNNYAIREYDRSTWTLRLYPILRFDYRVAPKTLLRFGIQGFPGFPELYRTRTPSYSRLYDYDRRRMVLAFENRTLYEGFNLIVMLGVRLTKTEYVNDPARVERDGGGFDYNWTEYFITLQSEATR